MSIPHTAPGSKASATNSFSQRIGERIVKAGDPKRKGGRLTERAARRLKRITDYARRCGERVDAETYRVHIMNARAATDAELLRKHRIALDPDAKLFHGCKAYLVRMDGRPVRKP